MIDIVKTNEIEEFSTYFPEYKDELIEFKEKFISIQNRISKIEGFIENYISSINKEEMCDREKAKYRALTIQKFCDSENLNKFISYFYLKYNYGKSELTPDEYLRSINSQKIYNYLNEYEN
jgi:hypothetical protein